MTAWRYVRYLAEDVVSVAKWAVGELVSELDYRLQPVHVREGWAAELADIEAGVDVHEPYAPYLQWSGAGDWPEECDGCHRIRRLDWDSDLCQECLNGPLEGPHYAPYCNRCGYPHPTTQTCLRDQSSAVPPTAERPAGVVADPPSAPPAGHPLSDVAQRLRDAVGDHYDFCRTPYPHGQFPFWHDDGLIDAFDWEGAARAFLDDVDLAPKPPKPDPFRSGGMTFDTYPT